MTTVWARLLIDLLGVYAGLGVLFAIAFVTVGVSRIDASARGAPVAFRLLIAPAAVALWPLLLGRWLRGAAPPAERNAHRDIRVAPVAHRDIRVTPVEGRR